MRKKRTRGGYTMLEMAVVIAIMGVMATLTAPGISEFLADVRASAATWGVVRLHNTVRDRALQTRLAHLVLFTASDDAVGSQGLGQFRVWEGMTDRCRQTPWMQTINGAVADGHQVVDSVNFAAYNPRSGANPSATDIGRQVISVRTSAGAAAAAFCVEPGGRTFVAAVDGTSAAIGYTFVEQTAPLVFNITRQINNSSGVAEPRGVTRQVVFAAGGNGRFRY